MKETRSHAFILLVDFWLLLGQSLSALDILQKILENHYITDYAISLLVLVTSAALSSLAFFSEGKSSEHGAEKLNKCLRRCSFFCAAILLIESGSVFLIIGVPYFAEYFPMSAVYFGLFLVPFRQFLNTFYDFINLWNR